MHGYSLVHLSMNFGAHHSLETLRKHIRHVEVVVGDFLFIQIHTQLIRIGFSLIPMRRNFGTEMSGGVMDCKFVCKYLICQKKTLVPLVRSI